MQLKKRFNCYKVNDLRFGHLQYKKRSEKIADIFFNQLTVLECSIMKMKILQLLSCAAGNFTK